MNLQPTLDGLLLHVRPLRPEDRDALYAAASDPRIWAGHPNPLRWKPEFRAPFVSEQLASQAAFAVIEKKTGALIGSSRYYEWDAAARTVAIGYTFLGADYWGGVYNGELKRLMLEHAFRSADAVIFHIGVDNKRSRRAVEKIGAAFDGLTEKVIDGKVIPYTVYRMTRP